MTKPARVALFIDAENASPKLLPQMLARCRVFGRLTVMRCYGGAAGLKKWEKANAENHILSVMTLASAAKANASDFALTIDAVALLHQNLFDDAVIVSSDADFTQLAVHIREHGKGIHGLGDDKAAQSLRTAYNSFTVLAATAAKKAKVATHIPPAPAPAKPAPAKPAPPSPAPKKAPTPPPPAKEIPRTQLLSTFEKLAASGTVTLATFGKTFRNDFPGVELGKGKLKKMLVAVGLTVDDKQVVTRNA